MIYLTPESSRGQGLKFIRFFIVSLVFFSATSKASSGQLGLGAIIGAPTGVSVAYKLSSRNMIDGAFGWSLGDDVNYHIHGDYLFLKPNAFQIDDIPMDIYFGVGARIKDRDTNDKDDDFRLGVRVPIGIHYQFDDPTIEVFGELAPILDLIESTTLDFNLGLGARFWF